MPPDALDRLARLRAIEERSAKLELARRLAAEVSAEHEAGRAAAAIIAESAGEAGAFARWLPRALAARERSATLVRLAARQSGEARAALAGAHRSSAVVEDALAARRAEAARQDIRKTQAMLDDLFQRNRRPRTG